MNKVFWWFQGEAVKTLFERLLLADPETARLEVHLDGRKMTFRVVPTVEGVGIESHTDEHINDSHVCPPVCPP